MLRISVIAFCAVDSLVPVSGRAQDGFEEFSAALERANIPVVWITDRTRLQMDQPRRKLGHSHPFIAEDGCAVYLPDGYFHLPNPRITRLGRFQCLPIAKVQPAASEALEALSSDTGVPVVALRTLSPTEFARNIGLPAREAGLARHRDFDELFFVAGAGAQDMDAFLKEATARKLQVRQQGALWSLAVGANRTQCVSEAFQLYQRSLRSRLTSFGITTSRDHHTELLRTCQRGVLLNDSASEGGESPKALPAKVSEIPLRAGGWQIEALRTIGVKT